MTRPPDDVLIARATTGANAIRPTGTIGPDELAANEARRRLTGHAAAYAARGRTDPHPYAGPDTDLTAADIAQAQAATLAAQVTGKPDGVDAVLERYLGPPPT